MPELPDVEGFRRRLARNGLGRRVERVEVPDPDLLRNRSPQGAGRALKGRELGSAERHGKWLVAGTGDGTCLLMHFGMTGELRWCADGAREPHPHDRVVLHLEGGELRFRDQRKFGGLWIARDERERREVIGPSGPDAGRVSAKRLGELLEGRRGAAKPALLDQALVAGIGNLIADEVLWRVRHHPRAPAAELGGARAEALHAALREVIRVGNRRGRVPPEPGWLTAVRDEPDARCPRCGTRLERGQVGGRSSVWCPRCQPEP